MSFKRIFLMLGIVGLSISFGNSQTIASAECLECHGDSSLTKTIDDSIEISLFIDNNKFSNSVHGGFECVDCHSGIAEIPHEENLKLPDC